MPENNKRFPYEPPVITCNNKVIRPGSASLPHSQKEPATRKDAHRQRELVVKLIHLLKSF